MNTQSNRVVIIAAVDQTAVSENVIHTATSLAPAIAGAELHFIYVIDVPSMVEGPYVSPLPELLREARVFLDGITRDSAAKFAGRIAGHIGVGPPADQILQLASDVEADLIVVGAHGRKALARMMKGSVSQSVVKRAPCAVLVARPKDYASVPEIEPACPKCLEVQRATHGDNLWCTQHSSRHAHGRLHYELPESFGTGSMFIRS